MKVKQIRYTLLIGVFSLIGIVVIQVYWLFTTWIMQQEKLDENIWLALKKVSAEINVLHECMPHDTNPVQKKSETCYLVDVGCEYNQDNLEYLVQTNLNKVNINIEHEIALFDCNINEVVYIGRYSGSGTRMVDSENLGFCQEPVNKEMVYFFCINISGRNNYLFHKMKLWLVLSLFVIIIVLFFTFTIFSFFKQKQLAELQNDFVNNITHELKTPISSINIASDVLLSFQNSNLPLRFINYASIIKQENSRMNLLVENVLKTARIGEGKTIMEIQLHNIHQMIEEVFSDEFPSNQSKSINVVKTLNADNILVNADKLHLTNIFFNLVDNAIKYNLNEVVLININTENIGKHLVVTFQDNGIGIPKQYKKKIFSKFFRVPKGNVHDVKGFGLGLYYVKQVCDAHNWKIDFISDLNEGTKFIIKMPFAKMK